MLRYAGHGRYLYRYCQILSTCRRLIRTSATSIPRTAARRYYCLNTRATDRRVQPQLHLIDSARAPPRTYSSPADKRQHTTTCEPSDTGNGSGRRGVSGPPHADHHSCPSTLDPRDSPTMQDEDIMTVVDRDIIWIRLAPPAPSSPRVSWIIAPGTRTNAGTAFRGEYAPAPKSISRGGSSKTPQGLFSPRRARLHRGRSRNLGKADHFPRGLGDSGRPFIKTFVEVGSPGNVMRQGQDTNCVYFRPFHRLGQA